VVPGQVAVLYDGERVLGGGTIGEALSFEACFDESSVDAGARPAAVPLGASA
jgi:hypothetical protein